jgi:hypothetical protein
VEVDFIVEVKYLQEEGVNPLLDMELGAKGVDFQEVEEDFPKDVGVGHLVAPN